MPMLKSFYRFKGMKGLGEDGGGGVPEINKTCPAITPTLSAEILQNGGFTTWAGGDPANWVDYGTEDASNYVIEGAGGGTAHLVSNGALIGIAQTGVMTKDKYYQFAIDITARTSGGLTATHNAGGLVFLVNQSTVKSYLAIGRATANGNLVLHRGAACDLEMDNASLKEVTGMDTSLGTISHQEGTYICHPTMTDDTQCGMRILYKDNLNFVQVSLNRLGTDQAMVLTCTNGVYAAVAGPVGNIVYGAGQELKAVVQADGTIGLYYNGAQVGANGVLTLANWGKGVYGFNSYASNQVGAVTTSKSVTP